MALLCFEGGGRTWQRGNDKVLHNQGPFHNETYENGTMYEGTGDYAGLCRLVRGHGHFAPKQTPPSSISAWVYFTVIHGSVVYRTLVTYLHKVRVVQVTSKLLWLALAAISQEHLAFPCLDLAHVL